MRAGKSPEQLKEENDRTTSLGLFNTAEAWRHSAMALDEANIKSGHAVKPVLFLYCHAVELYLKALLRQKHSVQTITKQFGHNTKRLVKEAEALGLLVTDGDREMFSIMVDTNTMIEARYIRTGSKTWPPIEDLCRTCKSVRDSVGDLLHKAGVPVRL